MHRFFVFSSTFLLALFAGLVLRSWLLETEAKIPIARRLPGTEPGTVLKPTAHCGRLTVKLETFTGKPGKDLGSWPCFRGRDYNSVAPTAPTLDPDKLKGTIPPRWTIELGDGHAGAAIFAGCVYVLDYDEIARRDALRCFSLDTGEEIWRSSYPIEIKRNHGMSRTVPAVSQDVVVSLGPKGQVMCVERQSGTFLWSLDLAHEYGTTIPLWYTAQCPIIENGRVILAPAGDDLLLAVNCDDGEIVWRVPNLDNWEMSHSSITPMRFGDQRAYVYAALGGMIAVSAEPGSEGTVLWKSTDWHKRIVAPCPVQFENGDLFVTSGHGAGSALFQTTATSCTLLKQIPTTSFACEQQTPIVWNGHLFGVLPKDAGSLREQFVCWHPEKGVVWASGRERRFGLGPWMKLGDAFLVLGDRGDLFAFRASSENCEELGRVKLLDGRDAWAPLAYAGGRLILRDAHQMLCLDLEK